ncbi:MAG: dephospho-CoA kinase [Bacteroidia bacterium]
MIIIGLTGGIGSGKTTIAKVFEALGISIYYSDERAKELYFIPHVKKEIENLLGKEAYLDSATLNRKYVAEKIFSDDELLKQVNAIIHAEVKNDFNAFKEKHQAEKYIIKESALLVEANLLSSVDKLIVVTSTNNLREQRIIKRDGLSKNEFQNRINKQLPDTEKIKHATWVIENNEEDLLIPQILQIHQSLLT